ncbi:hypothetical protein Q31a_50600 [Aureliella helgolandensis]|uniref:Uncharacterized protein n=1 Tax=Aureliella helgolandensis TaxID=2527968 RepID=A0A518GDL7_9BACT|nr:hypothetical protein Q31a_50600 [Aureliella helgolandensis]
MVDDTPHSNTAEIQSVVPVRSKHSQFGCAHPGRDQDSERAITVESTILARDFPSSPSEFPMPLKVLVCGGIGLAVVVWWRLLF